MRNGTANSYFQLRYRSNIDKKPCCVSTSVAHISTDRNPSFESPKASGPDDGGMEEWLLQEMGLAPAKEEQRNFGLSVHIGSGDAKKAMILHMQQDPFMHNRGADGGTGGMVWDTSQV
jgi:hypothetical protein